MNVDLPAPLSPRTQVTLPASTLVVMFSSGALLFWSQPIKAYESVFFRAKLAMLLLAALNAAVYHTTIFRRTNEWDDAPVPPAQARLTGWISLALWAGVIAAGRTMAYTL